MKYIAPPYLATRVHCIYNISSYSIYACIKQGIAHYIHIKPKTSTRVDNFRETIVR